MDKKKSLLNVSIAIGFKVILLVLTLFSKRFLIQYVGNDANGVYALYVSIIGFLEVAELGVGTAITFSMYEPIVKGDTEKVVALYRLFVKFYRIVGIVILVVGCCLLPALPYLAKDYQADFSLYVTFVIMLVSVDMTYLFSSKTSLINAYKNNYITTTISSVGQIFQNVAQMVVVYFFRSFELYLACRIGCVVVQWVWTEIYTRKHHREIIRQKAKLDDETKRQVLKSTKAMFMHKIGSLLVNTADSLIISAFIGVVILGKYSNYTTIMTAMTGVLTLCFTPLTSVIGHMCAENNLEEEQKYFKFFYGFNFILACVFFLGYYAVIDDVVTIFFGNNLELEKQVSFVITLNYFIQFMRQTTLLFRDATGTFYSDRWKPLLEGLLNVGLSIAFVYAFGITGVIVATIITNLLICHIVEPFVLYKHAFHRSPKRYYWLNYGCIAIFALMLVGLHFIMGTYDNPWISFLVNGFIAVGLALVPCTIMIFCNREFRDEMKTILKKIKQKLSKRKENPPMEG